MCEVFESIDSTLKVDVSHHRRTLHIYTYRRLESVVYIMGDPHSVHVIEHPEEFRNCEDGLTYQAVRVFDIHDSSMIGHLME